MEHSLGVAGSHGSPAAKFAVVPWRDLADRAQWDALANCAGEPNPYAERWCVEAGLTAFDPSGDVMLGTLRVGGHLAGIIPLVRHKHYERYPFPHLASWRHANAFCGSPLIAAGHERAFCRALFDWADANAGAALFLHLVGLPADGPFYAALRETCAEESRSSAVVHWTDRAMLASNQSPQDHFEATLSGKKRKELRRQFARLSDEGTVVCERRADDDGLDDWIAAFLALERSGWKGRAGSALACYPANATFFRAALSGAAAHGRLERLAITLDSRPVAMLVNFITPPGAYSFKTAYDERYARFSPGVLLQRENLELLARDDVVWADSCAAADHPMIEHIWRDKRRIVRVSVAIGGSLRQAAAAAIFRAETRHSPKGL